MPGPVVNMSLSSRLDKHMFRGRSSTATVERRSDCDNMSSQTRGKHEGLIADANMPPFVAAQKVNTKQNQDSRKSKPRRQTDETVR